MFLDVERPRVDPLEDSLLGNDLFPELANEVCHNQKETCRHKRRPLSGVYNEMCPLGQTLGNRKCLRLKVVQLGQNGATKA